MREYIIESGTVSEEQIAALAGRYKGTVYAIHTDHFYCGNNLEIDTSHLTELRIFNQDEEFRAIRFELGKEFRWRYINDKTFASHLGNETDSFLADMNNRKFDEIQYLDIDSERSEGTSYVTTGGGYYSLPVERAERIEVRNYLDYDDNGIVKINDMRIVRIIRRGEQ